LAKDTLQGLGIEHIPASSPQARGRRERLHRTLQDRLVKGLQLHGISTADAANACLREHVMAAYNEEFSRPPADPRSAFVPCEGVDLDHVLCHEEERTIGQDNVVTLEALALQLAKQPGRRTCAGLRVLVHRHLDGRHTVWHGPAASGLRWARAPRGARRRPAPDHALTDGALRAVIRRGDVPAVRFGRSVRVYAPALPAAAPWRRHRKRRSA
jgi:hypothetical protein